jgi:MFS family permease
LSRTERGPVALVCALFALEACLYSTLAPLLPHYAHDLGLSRAGAGVLTGAYSAGLVPGALIGGRVSARAGVRATIVVGLVVLGAGSVGFGFAHGVAALIVARTVQGVASGCVWGGGLTWLSIAAPGGRRGTVIGLAFGAATIGTLSGPALGALALAIGPGPLFSLVGAFAAGLLVPVVRSPEPSAAPPPKAPPPSPLASPPTSPLRPISPLAPLRERSMRLPIWVNTVQALPFGLVGAAVPLRLTHLGASEGVVAATFLLASCLGAVISPLAGRVADRRGQLLPIRAGLALSAPCLLALPLPASVAVVSAVTVVLMGGLVSMSLAPSVAYITDAGERAAVAPAVPAVLMTTVAVGETLGSAGGAGLGQLTFAAAPFAVLALVNLTTAALLTRAWRRRPGSRPLARDARPAGCRSARRRRPSRTAR